MGCWALLRAGRLHSLYSFLIKCTDHGTRRVCYSPAIVLSATAHFRALFVAPICVWTPRDSICCMDKVYPAMLARQDGIPSLLHSTLRAMRQYDCWRLRSYLSIGDRTRGAIECIGGATALRFDDVGYFNRVYDFGADTVARIDEIMEFYGIHGRLQAPAGTTPRRGVELIAGEGFELSDAADTLRRHGFQPAKRMGDWAWNCPIQTLVSWMSGASCVSPPNRIVASVHSPARKKWTRC